jgi:hypothetical protein
MQSCNHFVLDILNDCLVWSFFIQARKLALNAKYSIGGSVTSFKWLKVSYWGRKYENKSNPKLQKIM